VFKERIREYYDDLTPGFRKLADFLVLNTMDAAFLTASELARQVGVDPATVVRFSQEIGYSGYRELSREIKRYVRDQVTATYREAKEAKTEEDVLNVILDNTEQQLQHFRATEIPSLAKVIEVLKQASRIWITGEFTSFDLAISTPVSPKPQRPWLRWRKVMLCLLWQSVSLAWTRAMQSTWQRRRGSRPSV